ncbi:MAG TPA: hypothetical protein VJB37_01045 [Patescibacteria group bacterium]|nr:hypothetical protein [Patescibacteria group bacterium]
MYLLLDLSRTGIIHLSLFDQTERKEAEYPGQNRELLEKLVAFLQENRLTVSELSGLSVVVGTGGFTSTRLTAVVANLIGFQKQLPLLAVPADRIHDYDWQVKEFVRQIPGQLISPTYSGQPNITQKKKAR